MTDHPRSALVSLAVLFVIVVASQVVKSSLATSREGTVIGGGIGASVFLFTLTTASNMKMTLMGDQVHSGLMEVVGSLVLGMVVASSIHRVSVTVSLLLSLVLLLFLNGVSHTVYSSHSQVPVPLKKRK